MNKRILSFCLALALCLSLIPAAAFTADPTYTYTEVKTGIKATGVSMMGNGYGSYKILDEYDELVSKGVISPSGKTVLTRIPGEQDPHNGEIGVSTHYSGVGNVIVDLLPVYDGPADNMIGMAFDINLYGTDGKLITSAKKIIAAYEKADEAEIACSMTSYFGNDGYLTMFAKVGSGIDVYAYIIDCQTQKVAMKQWSYEESARAGGENWTVTSVNEGLIAYNHGEYKETDDGYYGYEYTTAGWMDIKGNHKVSIDPDKYNNWWNFNSGLATVTNMTGLWYGYVDKNGKEVIPCIYADGSMFKDGYAYVKDEDYRVGYIDTAGKTVIPFEYEYAFGYGEGLFTVGHAGQYDEYYGMVDINNTEVVPMAYTDISIVKNGVAYAIKDGEIVILKFAEAEPPAPADPTAVENIFKDVPSNAWYLKFLQKAYDNRIVGGKGAGKYDPNGSLKNGEIMVMAAQLHSRMKDDGYDFQAHKVAGAHWAQPYQDYCKAEGIIDARFDEALDVNVTRAEMAYYFANTLNDAYYKNKKSITFSDMPENGYDGFIMKLAEADIVGGYDVKDSDTKVFRPANLVTRAEAAVFISNILDAMGEAVPAADSRM